MVLFNYTGGVPGTVLIAKRRYQARYLLQSGGTRHGTHCKTEVPGMALIVRLRCQAGWYHVEKVYFLRIGGLGYRNVLDGHGFAAAQR